jgi:hypothetical protein
MRLGGVVGGGLGGDEGKITRGKMISAAGYCGMCGALGGC